MDCKYKRNKFIIIIINTFIILLSTLSTFYITGCSNKADQFLPVGVGPRPWQYEPSLCSRSRTCYEIENGTHVIFKRNKSYSYSYNNIDKS